MNHNRLERQNPSNQTMTLRKNQRSNVQAKVNTGLYPGSNCPPTTKSSVPIMKFKEKFPNHQHQRSNNNIDYDILRKNSIYDDSPKTVPGVRTGGISPTKSDSL